MPDDNLQTDELKKGYCEVLNALGYGAAKPEADFWYLNIVTTIPNASTAEFDNKFLFAVGNICRKYGWEYSTYPPSIPSDWTFRDLFNYWFLKRVTIPKNKL